MGTSEEMRTVTVPSSDDWPADMLVWQATNLSASTCATKAGTD